MGRVEKALLDILKENNGEAYQSELVRRSGFSRSRVSEVLTEMKRNGLVSKIPLGIGKNFAVSLCSDTEERGTRRTHEKTRKRIRLGFTRAAEYPFVLPFRKILKDRFDLDLDLRIYENGIDVTRDLSLLRLDLGIAPILTQFMFYSLGSPIKIIAPAGSGGSSLLASNRKRSKQAMHRDRGATELKVASTKLSTMELLLRSSVNGHVLPQSSSVVYSSSPEEMMNDLESRRVDAACIWEPYATMLLAKKKDEYRSVIRYNDIGEHLCCALATGNHLDEPVVRRIQRAFSVSLEQCKSNHDSFVAPYSALTGFDWKLLGQVSGEYSYPMELDLGMISRQFKRAGIRIPSPFSVRDAISVAG